MRLPWAGDGSLIDVVRMYQEIRSGERGNEDMRRMLFEVWGDAYTQGYSDGSAGRDPGGESNPYSTKGEP